MPRLAAGSTRARSAVRQHDPDETNTKAKPATAGAAIEPGLLRARGAVGLFALARNPVRLDDVLSRRAVERALVALAGLFGFRRSPVRTRLRRVGAPEQTIQQAHRASLALRAKI